jgi:hypothetical protein
VCFLKKILKLLLTKQEKIHLYEQLVETIKQKHYADRPGAWFFRSKELTIPTERVMSLKELKLVFTRLFNRTKETQFTKDYISGYQRCWINQIKDYTP